MIEMKSMAMLAVAMLAGCVSVSKDGMTYRSLGKDLNLGNGTWTKITSNSAETITFGGNATSSSAETTHMIGNVSMAAIGALIGSSAGPVGTGVGAGAGTSISEIWQSVQDYLKGKQTPSVTPTTTTTTVPPPGPPAPVPAPVASYGDPCNTPDEDKCHSGEGRFGSSPPVGVISVNDDKVLGSWAEGFFTRSGDNLTAVQTLTGPSGKIYVVSGWRVAYSSAPLQTSLTVTAADHGNVTRLYVVAHNAK